MKFRFKNRRKLDLGYVGVFLKKLCLPFSRLIGCFALMPRYEKIIAGLLLLTALILGSYKANQYYHAQTILMPAEGGEYGEALIGEIKYLNPILATNSAEKSISNLIFRGLIKIGAGNEVLPDLADRWEISGNGQNYTFYLKPDQKFSDGVAITANDVAFTIASIQTPETKSPLQAGLANVLVSVVDESTLTFALPQAYGPFIYNLNFGVIPAHLSSDEFSKKLTGSGPYKFSKFSRQDNKITEVELVRNENAAPKTYLEKVIFHLYVGKEEALNNYKNDKKTIGIFGADSGIDALDYQSSKQLGLIFNLRQSVLADKETRRKIIAGEKFDEPLSISLTSLDAPMQKDKAEEIKTKLAEQNVQLDVKLLSAVALQDGIDARDYELLLYGFDFGSDRDPYAFWHSSQLNAKNYAGWSDKKSDILLEDARMLIETDKRNAKYVEFDQIVANEYLAIFYDPVSYDFAVKSDILKGAAKPEGTQACSRFDNIESWFVKEKRVRK